MKTGSCCGRVMMEVLRCPPSRHLQWAQLRESDTITSDSLICLDCLLFPQRPPWPAEEHTLSVLYHSDCIVTVAP